MDHPYAHLEGQFVVVQTAAPVGVAGGDAQGLIDIAGDAHGGARATQVLRGHLKAYPGSIGVVFKDAYGLVETSLPLPIVVGVSRFLPTPAQA